MTEFKIDMSKRIFG